MAPLKSVVLVVQYGRLPRDRSAVRELVLRWPNLFSWDCTRKKVIPIIARGVELSDCGEKRTPCFLRGPERACRASFGAGGAVFWCRHIIPDLEFWNPSGNPQASADDSANNIHDYAPDFTDGENRRIPLSSRAGAAAYIVAIATAAAARRLTTDFRITIDRLWLAKMLPADGER